jgi:hypothetical protein
MASAVPYMEAEDTVVTAARDACAALLPNYATAGLPVMVAGTASKTENRAVLATLKERGVVGDPVRQHAHVYALPVFSVPGASGTGAVPAGMTAVLGFHPVSALWFAARAGAPVVAGASLQAVVDFATIGRSSHKPSKKL